MNKRSVGLIILWWVEVIISIRVLLFAIPVMINKYSAASFSAKNLEDRFMIVVTGAAVFYLLVGVMSIRGVRFWKGAHYLAVFFICVLTVGSLRLPGQLAGGVALYYFLPLIVSVAISVLAVILKGAKQVS